MKQAKLCKPGQPDGPLPALESADAAKGGLGYVETDVCMSCKGAPRQGCFAQSFICQAAGSADIDGLEACVATWEFTALPLTK